MEIVNRSEGKNLMGLSRHQGKAGIGWGWFRLMAEMAVGRRSNPTALRGGEQALGEQELEMDLVWIYSEVADRGSNPC